MAMRLKSKSKNKPSLSLKKKGEVGSYFLRQTATEFVKGGAAILNCILGGGWAVGRIVNLIGDRSTGKTLLAIEACCNFVMMFPSFGKIRYLEPEAAFDKSYAAALGLPIDRVDFADEGIDTVEAFHDDLEEFLDSLKDDEPGLYIVDSLDSLSSMAERARKITDNSYGDGKAKKMSELFRRLNQKIKSKRVLLFIISQVRDNIGVTFGAKHTRSGGKALDFYASQIVWLAQTGMLTKVINKVSRAIGVSVRAKCTKNKVGIPFRECSFDIVFGYGVDDIAANIKYLSSVNKLHMIQPGLQPDKVNRFIETINSQNADTLVSWRERLNKVVLQAWNDVETSFLPKRKKY